MSALTQSLNEARHELIDAESESLAEVFQMEFGLNEGDHLRYTDGRGRRKVAKIGAVEDVFANQKGGHTARLQVFPLKADGRLGCARYFHLTRLNRWSPIRGIGHTTRDCTFDRPASHEGRHGI